MDSFIFKKTFDRIYRIYKIFFITFQKKVMKPNPPSGKVIADFALDNFSAAKRMMFFRFLLETGK